MPVKQSTSLIEWLRRHGVKAPPEVELGAIEQPVTLVRDDSGLVRPLSPSVGMFGFTMFAVALEFSGLEIQAVSPGGIYIRAAGTFTTVGGACQWVYSPNQILPNNRAAGAPIFIPGRSTDGLVPAFPDVVVSGSAGAVAGDPPRYAFGTAQFQPGDLRIWIPSGHYFALVGTNANTTLSASIIWQQIP